VETPRRIDLRQTVQRTTAAQLTRPLVERSLALCQEVLSQVGLDAEDLTQVIVTGGITALPFVRDAVARAFGRPISTDIHPDEAVALGAGLRAAMLAGHSVVGTGRVARAAVGGPGPAPAGVPGRRFPGWQASGRLPARSSVATHSRLRADCPEG
jgi:molecular chaperone DnaK (HSP70)